MKLQLLNRILATPWAARRESLSLLTQLVIAGDKFSNRAPELSTTIGTGNFTLLTADGTAKALDIQRGYTPLNWEAAYAANGALPQMPAGVHSILVWGILGRGWTMTDKYWLDAIDVDDLTNAIAAVPEGDTCVLWFRSPGGIVTGIAEAAATIRKLRTKRRILAFTDDLCASAAMWLAAQCERIDSTPSAELGSIGVYLAYYDWCQYLENAGIKLELFKAGALKGTGLQGNPLDAAARQHLQEGVDEWYRLFTADVLRNREIDPDHMQGQTLTGKAALAANFADAFFPSAADYLTAIEKGKV